MAEANVVKIQPAHDARKERGDAITFAESYAREVVSGKIKATPRILEMSVKYLLDVDSTRKKQRLLSLSERRKKKEAPQASATAESQITPELAKRLALLGEK